MKKSAGKKVAQKKERNVLVALNVKFDDFDLLNFW